MPRRKWWPPKTDTLARAAHYVTIVGFPLLLISTFFVIWSVNEPSRIARVQNTISLNRLFFTPDNMGTFSIIEKGVGPILTDDGGSVPVQHLDKYLGDFDTIDEVYRDGLITEGQLCRSFFYYVVTTMRNERVAQYLKKNPNYFGGIQDLSEVMARSKKRDCH